MLDKAVLSVACTHCLCMFSEMETSHCLMACMAPHNILYFWRLHATMFTVLFLGVGIMAEGSGAQPV